MQRLIILTLVFAAGIFFAGCTHYCSRTSDMFMTENDNSDLSKENAVNDARPLIAEDFIGLNKSEVKNLLVAKYNRKEHTWEWAANPASIPIISPGRSSVIYTLSSGSIEIIYHKDVVAKVHLLSSGNRSPVDHEPSVEDNVLEEKARQCIKEPFQAGKLIFSLILAELNMENTVIDLCMENTTSDAVSTTLPGDFLPYLDLYFPDGKKWIIPWEQLGIPHPGLMRIEIKGGEKIKVSIRVPSQLGKYQGSRGTYKFFLRLDKRFIPQIAEKTGDEGDPVLCLEFPVRQLR